MTTRRPFLSPRLADSCATQRTCVLARVTDKPYWRSVYDMANAPAMRNMRSGTSLIFCFKSQSFHKNIVWADVCIYVFTIIHTNISKSVNLLIQYDTICQHHTICYLIYKKRVHFICAGKTLM